MYQDLTVQQQHTHLKCTHELECSVWKESEDVYALSSHLFNISCISEGIFAVWHRHGTSVTDSEHWVFKGELITE